MIIQEDSTPISHSLWESVSLTLMGTTLQLVKLKTGESFLWSRSISCKPKLILNCNKDLKTFIWTKGTADWETDSDSNLNCVPLSQRKVIFYSKSTLRGSQFVPFYVNELSNLYTSDWSKSCSPDYLAFCNWVARYGAVLIGQGQVSVHWSKTN